VNKTGNLGDQNADEDQEAEDHELIEAIQRDIKQKVLAFLAGDYLSEHEKVWPKSLQLQTEKEVVSEVLKLMSKRSTKISTTRC
jgi:hypothetical protein